MTLLDSLLEAIIRLDGEALVMHVGEKPYIVLGSASVSALRGPLAWGQVELSSRPLTGAAMSSMLTQMLTDEQRRTLDELGAIEEEIPAPGDSGGRFVVTAARGGDDVWVEVRRRKETRGVAREVPAEAAGSDEAIDLTEAQTEVLNEAPVQVAVAPSAGVDSIDLSSALDAAEPAPAVGEALLTERIAALEREAADSLAAREAELLSEAEASLAARHAELEAEAARALSDKQAALAASMDERLAAKETELLQRMEAELSVKTRELAAHADASLNAKQAEINEQLQAAIAAREAAFRDELQQAIALKEREWTAQADAALAEKEAALRAQTESAEAAREAAARAEAERAAIAQRTEAALAEREAAMKREADAARASAEAAAAAEVERILALKTAEITAHAERVVAEREAALKNASEAVIADREATVAAEAERVLAEKRAALEAEAERASNSRQRALDDAEKALAARELSLREETERHAAEIAEMRRRLDDEEAALEAKARRAAQDESERIAELQRALAAKEAALSAQAVRLTEKEDALAAEVQRALAEKETAIAEARRLAEKAVALSVETQRAFAEKEQAMAAESRRVLAERESALSDEMHRALAERESALSDEMHRALAERESALGEEMQRTIAAREAAVVGDAERRLAEREAALTALQRDLVGKEAALAAEARRVADREARIAQIERERVAIESSQAAEAEAMRTADAEAARIAETLAQFSAEQDAVHAAAESQSVPRSPVASDAAPNSGAVVTPIARTPLKLQPPQPVTQVAASTEASLVELLRAAAEHGASMVYAVVDTRPMMRLAGEIAIVGTQAPVAAGDVERFIFQFAPRELVADATPEWTCTVPNVGRVRCVAFQDHSGAGLIFHLPSRELAVADDLSLGDELRALCDEADGLIVVAGPRSTGKSALLSEFVDVINSTRYDHVITIESQIRRVHEKRLSFISQREVRGDGDAIAKAARTALREGPDVLVIEDLRAPEALVAALDAARAGRLVFGSISAPTTSGAIERLIDAFPADRRPQVRASLAGALRAVVAQILVPKISGGRIAAREVLLSSPAVRKVILDGAISQLPIAIESGRNLGMRTMVDALGRLVRDGIVSIGAACTAAPDRLALISALERDGIDVSGVEKRA